MLGDGHSNNTGSASGEKSSFRQIESNREYGSSHAYRIRSRKQPWPDGSEPDCAHVGGRSLLS